MTERTVVHLLRHGEVFNPDHILYGRLPGYHLSADGVAMAEAARDWFTGRDVVALFSSPMERAQETAAPLAAATGLPVTIEERLIEAGNQFEGHRFGHGAASLTRAKTWAMLRNPFQPSWGEPYEQVAERMLAAAERARDAARGHEAVCVSHQLPIVTARRRAEQRRLWHNPAFRQCSLASVTSIVFTADAVTGVQYAEPAAAIVARVKRDREGGVPQRPGFPSQL